MYAPRALLPQAFKRPKNKHTLAVNTCMHTFVGAMETKSSVTYEIKLISGNLYLLPKIFTFLDQISFLESADGNSGCSDLADEEDSWRGKTVSHARTDVLCASSRKFSNHLENFDGLRPIEIFAMILEFPSKMPKKPVVFDL
jgi:hypothetical protein